MESVHQAIKTISLYNETIILPHYENIIMQHLVGATTSKLLEVNKVQGSHLFWVTKFMAFSRHFPGIFQASFKIQKSQIFDSMVHNLHIS